MVRAYLFWLYICVGCSDLSSLLSACFVMTARCQQTIDVRTAIVNYPVPVGGVAEVLSVGRVQPARLRLFVLDSVGWGSVTAYMGEEDLEAEHFVPRFGLLMRFSFSEVVLPMRYIFLHPVGWYVWF
jgi:hypothetical protein